MTKELKITVTHEFTGYSDYWGGNGRRYDRNAGCAFAFYNADTSLRDCVDQWISDFCMGGDFENHDDGRDPWEDVTEDDIRRAILDSLTSQGRADYDSGALAECARDCEDERCCDECNAPIGEEHCEDCEFYDDGLGEVEPDHCEEYEMMHESPV